MKIYGDAQLVSTIPSSNETNTIENLIEGQTNTNESEEAIEKNEISTSTTVDKEENQNNKEVPEDFYFTTSKLERNTMYSELLETYQEMYNNSNATAEAKKEALDKINSINNIKNAIMISENLITAKGFEDAVIFVNEESVSVVIKAKELKKEDVAQIQNIVSRELNIGAETIHISNK